MSAPTAKGYQREAVVNALEIFHYAESQLRQAGDDASRAAATAFNGCLLLEAPTGSGKTLMAGLVEQAKGAIKSTFVGLRVRDLQGDRQTRGTQSGDVFVTTWASVAASNKETRRVRSSGEFVLALDDLIAELRADGFRIGALVDEAHHSFTKAAETVRFYHETLRPEFTLMITATPDDKDLMLRSDPCDVWQNKSSRECPALTPSPFGRGGKAGAHGLWDFRHTSVDCA